MAGHRDGVAGAAGAIDGADRAAAGRLLFLRETGSVKLLVANEAAECCPSCGQPLPVGTESWDAARRLVVTDRGHAEFTAMEAVLFDALWSRRGKPIYSIEAMMHIAYGERRDGGAENRSVISIMCQRIRTKIEPLGYTVTKNEGQPKRGYQFIKLEQANARK